jgi:hypothetical protein
MSLPAELNYNTNLDSILDGTVARTNYILPSNGQNFSLATSGTQIFFDIPSTSYMIPDTLMLTYSYKATSSGAIQQLAVPFTSVIARLEVLIGSQTAQTIPQFNQLSNMITNLTHSVAGKIGNAIGLGFRVGNTLNDTPQAETNNHADGAVLPMNATGNVGGALRCMLSEAQNPIPLILMQSVRIALTLDTIQNVFAPAVATSVDGDYRTGTLYQAPVTVPTDFVLFDLQLSYNSMDFPSAVTEALRMSPSPILIKSQGFSSTSQTLPTGTSGIVENVYNSRYASIKNLFLINSSNNTNGIFDSFHVSPNASYQFYVNSIQYPPLPITKEKNSYIELKKATGSAFDTIGNNFAINVNEYSYPLSATVKTTVAEPSKFYVGVSTEISFAKGRLLSGVSSENSALSVRISIPTPLPRTITSTLVVNYDMVIQIDPMTRSATVKM